ncbi:MAG TPA: hypothetical protein VG326_05595 [Tepidisphaeraceae bacterium]|jgi:hypothetical protein|nr:hypothetical protein [Tepidisphaeraceae bacterium]
MNWTSDCRGPAFELGNFVFVIRRKQIDALAQASYDGFVARATEHLKKFLPRHFEGLSSDPIRRYIDYCVVHAKRYGLESEQAVVAFAHLPLVCGYDFETHPVWRNLCDVLRMKECSPNDRAQLALLMAHELKASQ